jgi:hypothetical protein
LQGRFIVCHDIQRSAVGVRKKPGFIDDHLQQAIQILLGRKGYANLRQPFDLIELTCLFPGGKSMAGLVVLAINH